MATQSTPFRDTSGSQLGHGEADSHGTLNRKLRLYAVLSVLLFTLFLAALDFSIVTTAIPTISHQLQSQTAYVWIGSAYLLSSAAVAPIYGKLAEIWGRKSALLGAIVLFVAGSAICGWSQTAAQLIAGRAVQGSGAGGIIVLVNISISDMWSPRYRGMFLATTGLVWAISAGLGPLLGGAFAQYSSWRWAFWINLPCAFAAFLVLYLGLASGPSQVGSVSGFKTMDWFGTAAIMSMTVLILLSLDLGGVVFPWDSPKVYSLSVSGSVLLVVFVLWEVKGASNPLIPVRLLDSVSKAAPLLVCFTHGFINMASWYFLPLYFQAVRGASPVRSGVLLTPIVVVQAMVGVAVGGIIYRVDWVRPIIWVGMTLMTVGFSLFIIISTSTSLTVIFIIEIVVAMGIGAVFQGPLVAYQAAVGPSDMAVATALFGFVRSLSTSISVVVGGIVFENSIKGHSDQLRTVLGEGLAQNFSASNAASNVLTIQLLPLDQQAVVKDVYVSSLRQMWKMYTSIGALGLIAALFVKRHAFAESSSNITNTNETELSRRSGERAGGSRSVNN